MSEEENNELRHRKIRSFVKRPGRMTDGQKLAYEQNWPKYGRDIAQGPVDLHQWFGNEQPLVLEIGFGMGDSLVQMAKENPDHNYVGIEVHTPGVGRLLAHVEEQQLPNLKVYQEDAVEVLGQCISDDVLDRVQLFFPDPWHKKKHHKRRIVNAEFVALLRSKLKVDGVFHMATDWEPYAEHMVEVMEAAPGFDNVLGSGEFHPRPKWRPVTKFERRGHRLGHGVWDLIYKKR